MHWELSDEQELFSTSLRDWLAARFPSEVVRKAIADGTADSFTAALIDDGWWGVGYDEDDGGQGGGLLELALAAREFGRAAAPDAPWLAGALAMPVLTPAERAAQLSGESTHVLACRADRVPRWNALTVTDGRLTGSVPHVLAAQAADVFVVPVTGPDGPTLIRVAAEHARVSVDDLLDRSRTSGTVEFTDAPVLDSTTADPALVDLALLDDVAARAAVLVASASLGAAERMLDLAVEYSKQRKQFGQVIGSFQAVKHAAAQMLVTVEAAHSSALYAAAAVDAGLPDTAAAAAVAKAQVTGSVADLAESALTVHGAIGYTWEHDLHLYYKRAKLDRVLFGSSAAWNERIAHTLLD